MLGDPRDAEEAAQDAFVRAYRALARYDAVRIGELRLRPWLATIVLNLCRSRLGRRRPARSALSLDAALPGEMEPRTDPHRGPAESAATRDAATDLGRPAPDPATGLPQRRRAAARRRTQLPRSRGRSRSTRGHRQGPGPPRGGPAENSIRGRRAARTRGDDRMTTTDSDIEAAMAALRTTAPPTLRPGVLAELGLADLYARFDSPIGPLVVAWNGLGVSVVEATDDDAGFEASHLARTGRSAFDAGTLPPRLASAIARRLDGDRRAQDRPRPARPHRLRARRLAEGARDPARRGPSVRLGRRRDRPAEGGPGGRDGARPQPGPAHRALPPRRPQRRHHRPVLARRAGATSGRSSKPRASTFRGWNSSHRSGIRFIGSDTTRIYCLPTCRHARRVTDRHRREFHSVGRGRGARLSRLPRLQTGVRGGRRLILGLDS